MCGTQQIVQFRFKFGILTSLTIPDRQQDPLNF